MQHVEPYGLLLKDKSADIMQLVQTTPAWSLIFMQVGISLLALISIFLYKNRQLQLKFVAGGILLITIYVAYLLFVKIDGLETQIAALYSAPIVKYNKISIYFPALQLLLMILSQRAIKKDERLVRSSDRLR